MVKYNGNFIEKSDAWEIMDKMRTTLSKKKVYEFEYEYSRYNPQLGTSIRTSTVLACSESEAERKANASCKRYKSYGSMSYKGLTGNKKLLQNGVDYKWEVKLESIDFGNDKIVKTLERVY